MVTKKEALKQAQELAKSREIKEVSNKFNLGQSIISNNGVPANVVSIFLTPETAQSGGNKIKDPILYQVRDTEGSDKGVDRTLVEAAIFSTQEEYKAARIKELKSELKDLEK
jgi:uncharacterized protein (DUF2267 family)